MIYVITETKMGGGYTPTAYYTSAEGARRAVALWVQAASRCGEVVPSLSGMSAFDELDAIRATPVEEGTA